jgi:UDP-N-acetylmuramoyl-tripeptide--D-alanyl-D-alanine ligase
VVLPALLFLLFLAACDVGSWSHENLQERSARYPGDPKAIDAEALHLSVHLGAEHLCAQQTPEGLFRYEMDVVTGRENRQNNMIRQVGAFWATALLLTSRHAHLDDPLRQKVERTFERMESWIAARTKPLPGQAGATWVDLGGEVQTGAAALIALGYLERVAAGETRFAPALRGHLAFLAAARGSDGRFSDSWSPRRRRFGRGSNPYADGEALLALAKNRAVLGDHTYDTLLDEAAPALRDRWYASKEADERKGFYQWGSMAFSWIARARPERARPWQDVILKYSDWMVLEHKTLSRTRNTSYAVEGLATAFAVARERGDRTREKSLRYTILKTHARAISAQIGHPLSRGNTFVQAIPRARRESDRVRGGFLNGHAEPSLRIDVTQHAIHSILLTLEHEVLRRR